MTSIIETGILKANKCNFVKQFRENLSYRTAFAKAIVFKFHLAGFLLFFCERQQYKSFHFYREGINLLKLVIPRRHFQLDAKLREVSIKVDNRYFFLELSYYYFTDGTKFYQHVKKLTWNTLQAYKTTITIKNRKIENLIYL